MSDTRASSLSIANLWVAFIAFLAAALMGVYQVAERSGLFPSIESAEVYFASVSTHGVLMGFVLTTFVVVGTGYFWATNSLK
ncbi:MAG: cytochrome C oxidase subunit I, partial [Pseudomonadota bacterium]